MTLVYQLPPIPMTSFPWAVLDYIPIPIYFPKYNPNSPPPFLFPLKQKEF